MKNILPWWLKIIIKITLSRLPVSYRFWSKIGLFRHGNMDKMEYSINVLERHLAINGLSLEKINRLKILELGPGDSLTTAVLVGYYGGGAILVDSGNYATDDIKKYNSVYKKISKTVEEDKYSNIDDLLEKTNSLYMNKGIESLRNIPSNSVDFVFSQAVLEHIKLSEFVEIQSEIFRIMKVGATASHRIDLKDHLGGGLSNLILPKKIWESNIFYNSGFYTNRIRFSEMIEKFERVGFLVSVVEKNTWDRLPMSPNKMTLPYSLYSIDDLSCSGFTVSLKKPN